AVIAHVAASRVPAGAATGEQRLLLEAAARRVAYDALAELSDDLNRLDMTSPSIHGGNGLLPLHGPANGADAAPGHDHRVSYVSALLAIAEQSGLATQAGDHWQIAADCPLPPAPELVATLLQEEPRWLAEAVLLTRAATAGSAHLAGSAQS